MTKTLGDEMRDELAHRQWLIENGKLYDAMKERAERAESECNQAYRQLAAETKRREQAETALRAMNEQYSALMTRLAKYEQVTA